MEIKCENTQNGPKGVQKVGPKMGPKMGQKRGPFFDPFFDQKWSKNGQKTVPFLKKTENSTRHIARFFTKKNGHFRDPRPAKIAKNDPFFTN